MAERTAQELEARTTLAYLAEEFSPNVERRLRAAEALLAELAALSGQEDFHVHKLPEHEDADYEVRFEGAHTEVRVRLGVGGEIYIRSRSNDEKAVPLAFNRLTNRLDGGSVFLAVTGPRKSGLTALLEAIARFSGDERVELE